MPHAPLPLIIPDDSGPLPPASAKKGYLVLAVTWFLFIVTANSILGSWLYVIAPLRSSNPQLHARLAAFFNALDSNITSLWCVYIVCWWWALISWIGLKLFRQSKGIQN